MNTGGDKDRIPGEPLWGPPGGKPYDWEMERGWPKFPRSWNWEEIIAVALGIVAVLVAFWLLTAFID